MSLNDFELDGRIRKIHIYDKKIINKEKLISFSFVV